MRGADVEVHGEERQDGEAVEARRPLLAGPRPYLIGTDFRAEYGLLDVFGPAGGGGGPLHLEIGAGGGEFCVVYAARNPGERVIGIERKLTYLLRAVRKAARQPGENLRLVNGDALYLLSQHVPKGSLDAVHIYFPDPWPKRRHAKRRIFQAEPLNLVLSRIKAAGRLHIRTDVAGYFEQAMGLLERGRGLRRVEPPGEITDIQTNFESKFRARGLPIYLASFEVGKGARVGPGDGEP